MTIKRDGRGRKRDYKKEYRRDQKPKKDVKDRASRNSARSKLKCGANKEVHHKDGNPKNKKASNLKVTSKAKNRSFKRTKNARKA